MAKLMRLVEDILEVDALISFCFLIFTPLGLAIEDSYSSNTYYDKIEDNYFKDLLDSPLYSIREDHKPAVSPDPEFHTEVKKCLEKISDDCGVIIFNKIFNTGKYSDVEVCCSQLLTLGKECHHTIVESTLSSSEMKGVNKTEVWKNSDNLWKECGSVSI